jgi:hypothetical protein
MARFAHVARGVIRAIRLTRTVASLASLTVGACLLYPGVVLVYLSRVLEPDADQDRDDP